MRTSAPVPTWAIRKCVAAAELFLLTVGLILVTSVKGVSSDVPDYKCDPAAVCPSCVNTSEGYCTPSGEAFPGCRPNGTGCDWKTNPAEGAYCYGTNYKGGSCSNPVGEPSGSNCSYMEKKCKQ